MPMVVVDFFVTSVFDVFKIRFLGRVEKILDGFMQFTLIFTLGRDYLLA
ncbi:hypothetical protein [Methylotuvimicrobium sp. KM2]